LEHNKIRFSGQYTRLAHVWKLWNPHGEKKWPFNFRAQHACYTTTKFYELIRLDFLSIYQI